MSALHRLARLDVHWQTIAENVRALRGVYGSNVQLMIPVKANGYGHGAIRAAKTALTNGADRLAVAMVDEAIALRDQGIDAPILILGASMGQAVEEAVHHGVAMALQDEFQVREMRRAAQKLGRPAIAHIQVDTGMSRLGTRGDAEMDALLDAIGMDGAIRVEGIFTHYFAGTNFDICYEQHERLMQAVKKVRAAGHSPIVHGAASEASLLWPQLRDDCVRPGIATYGGCREFLPDLRWAMRLWAKPVRLRRIEQGDTVGYGGVFCAKRPTLVMTVPVGYADGYPRLLGGRASALVCGQRAPVIGRVCMDMLMLDVTDVPNVCMKDEVVLMGAQGDEAIWPDEMARWADTISYEIITGLQDRLARRDIEDETAAAQQDSR